MAYADTIPKLSFRIKRLLIVSTATQYISCIFPTITNNLPFWRALFEIYYTYSTRFIQSNKTLTLSTLLVFKYNDQLFNKTMQQIIWYKSSLKIAIQGFWIPVVLIFSNFSENWPNMFCILQYFVNSMLQ